MKKRLPLLVLAAICLQLSIKSFSQSSTNNVLDSLAGKLLAGVSNQPSLFAHLDKSIQPAGGVLWFKIYMYQQSSHLPFVGSVTVHADLIDEQGKMVDQILLESTDMRLEGAFQLSRELVGGTYYLRVYTAEMVKTDPQQIFITPVYIYNPSSGTSMKPDACLFTSGSMSNQNGIRFYSEGDWLINGIDNIVAVHALDKTGNPLKVEGVIKDTRDSIVARFQTNALGMARFSIFPYKGRKYKAIIGQEQIALPAVPLNAHQLALVKEDEKNFQFRVALSDLLYPLSPSSYLVGMSNGRICFTAAGKGMYLVSVPKNKFPNGVAEFYLFDEKQQQVSHRKVFIEKKDVRVTIEPDKKQYMRRATVKLSITLSDTSGKAIPALLSVSVTDKQALPEQASPSFPSYIWNRSASLPATIVSANNNLKDLMLLINDDRPSDAVKQEKTVTGLVIAGRLFDENKQPVGNQSISVFSEQERSILLSDTTDANGYFSLRPVRFYDSTQFMLYVDAKNQKIKDWTVQLSEDSSLIALLPKKSESCFSDSLFSRNIYAFEKNRPDTFLTGNTKGWLEEVVIRGTKKGNRTQLDSKQSRFSRVITREQLKKVNPSNTANAVMMLPGVMMMGNQLTIRGGIPALSPDVDRNVEPLVVVDGVQAVSGTGVVTYLNSIQPENIDYIEVMTGPEAAQFGTRGGNGVILIKTGPPQHAFKQAENIITFSPKGYHYPLPFYQPDYNNDAVREASFNDNRSTIYWNGNLTTDEKGKATVQFFSADPRTVYTITVMGLTSKGVLIHEEITVSRNN